MSPTRESDRATLPRWQNATPRQCLAWSQATPRASRRVVAWAVTRGAVLIKNDCFDGATIVDGKITLWERPGIGVVKGRVRDGSRFP